MTGRSILAQSGETATGFYPIGLTGYTLGMEALMARPSPFGERLKALRTAAGLTLAQLAERAGMNLHGIAKIESGERPNPGWETVCALAAALGVTPNDFLDSDEPTAEPERPAPRRKRKK